MLKKTLHFNCWFQCINRKCAQLVILFITISIYFYIIDKSSTCCLFICKSDLVNSQDKIHESLISSFQQYWKIIREKYT